MANKCLVTKLQSVVNNDDLNYLGMLRFIVPDHMSPTVIGITPNKTLKAINTGGQFLNGSGGSPIGNEMDITSTTTIYSDSNTKYIHIDKNGIITLYNDVLYIDVQSLYGFKAADFRLRNSEQIIDLAEWKKQNIEIANRLILPSGKGDIADLFPSIQNASIVQFYNGASELYGDLYSWRNRSAGTMSFTILANSGSMTFNGTSLSTISPTGKFTLTFDGNGNMTCTEAS